MKFELIGKTKAKVTKVMPFAIKLGQKDIRPGAQLRIMATVSNTVLNLFFPGFREFLFDKAKGSDNVQKNLDGIPVVSDLPNLREPGVKLGALHWEDEQTGCTLIIDRAIDPITLKDGKVNKFKIAPKDGGSVQVFFTFTTGEIDQDTAGHLMLLHQNEITVELTIPEPLQQQGKLDDDDDDSPLTPEKALATGKPADDKAGQVVDAEIDPSKLRNPPNDAKVTTRTSRRRSLTPGQAAAAATLE